MEDDRGEWDVNFEVEFAKILEEDRMKTEEDEWVNLMKWRGGS